MEPISSRWPGQKIPPDGDNVAAPPATPRMGVERRPLRMLLLEDDPLLKWAITETLKIGGHVTLEACDVAAAERAVQSAPGAIDVVLFDDHIPERDQSRCDRELPAACTGKRSRDDDGSRRTGSDPRGAGARGKRRHPEAVRDGQPRGHSPGGVPTAGAIAAPPVDRRTRHEASGRRN